MTQTTLDMQTTELIDRLWRRHAQRECLAYREHLVYTENIGGTVVCADCGGL